MSADTEDVGIVVRTTGPDDAWLVPEACALIASVVDEYDIALRTPAFVEQKVVTGRAAVALEGDTLLGFGYWSDWEGGAFVSHSGLVVREGQRGRGLGRRIKTALFDSSRARFPRAKLMSLTTSPRVKALNESLGFRVVPLERLTKDPAFWEGCRTCRNYSEVRARGDICCCEGMLLDPEQPPGTEQEASR